MSFWNEQNYLNWLNAGYRIKNTVLILLITTKMLKPQHTGFFIILFMALFVIFLLSKSTAPKEVVSSDDILQEIGLSSLKSGGFDVNKYYLDEQKKSIKAIFNKSENLLKIEVIKGIDKRSADILLEDNIIMIRALYGNALSPYPGEISNELICNENFLPEFNTKQTNLLEYSYFILFANDRLTYGACSEDIVRYKSILAWAYCDGKNSFYQFEFFSPIEMFSESDLDLITSFRCSTA